MTRRAGASNLIRFGINVVSGQKPYPAESRPRRYERKDDPRWLDRVPRLSRQDERRLNPDLAKDFAPPREVSTVVAFIPD